MASADDGLNEYLASIPKNEFAFNYTITIVKNLRYQTKTI